MRRRPVRYYSFWKEISVEIVHMRNVNERDHVVRRSNIVATYLIVNEQIILRLNV